jgi:hypothetical protein
MATRQSKKNAITQTLASTPNATQFEAKSLPTPFAVVEAALAAKAEAKEAKKLAPREILTFGVMTFDPVDFICTRINTDEARFSILRSMAWYIDMALLGEIKALYFKMFADLREAGEVESYSEFVRAMDVQDARERNLEAQGFAAGSGVHTVRLLATLRSDWHDRAHAHKTDYIMPSVTALIRGEKPQMPDALSKLKLKDLAEDMSEGDEEEAKALYLDLLSREEMVATNRHEAAVERQRALVSIYEFVDHTNVDCESDVEFVTLPTILRARIVTGMLKTIDTTLVQLATNRKVGVLEYAAARKELKAVVPELKALQLTRLCDGDAVDMPADDSGTAGSAWQNGSELKSVMRQGIASARKH